MRIQTSYVLAGVVLLCNVTSVAEEETYAPLPDKVVAAKTVFFVNESGTARFLVLTAEYLGVLPERIPPSEIATLPFLLPTGGNIIGKFGKGQPGRALNLRSGLA